MPLGTQIDGLKETESLLYRGPLMHFHAPHFIALRGGDRNEETPATKNKREMLMRPRLRTCTQPNAPYSCLLLEQRFQPTPSPLCGLASCPLLDACAMSSGKQFLT